MFNIIVFIGPSGSGKTTLSEKLNLDKIITYTTRKPRINEIQGKDYFFVEEEEFKLLIKEGKLLEYSEYNGNFYGTSVNSFDKLIKENAQRIIILDINGVKKIKELFKDKVLVVGVFCPINQGLDRLESRKDENFEARRDNFSKETHYMLEVCDIAINNSREKWEAINSILEIISKGSL